MSFIQQITDESCFVRLIWDDGTEQDINKTDLKLFLRGELVVIEDDSPFSGEIDYTKVTNPFSASALILHDAIRVFADTNPCDAGGGSGTPGGANKQVQYNDSGAFGAEVGFEYDKATNELTVPDLIDSGLTASEIVGTNGSKKLVSLAVATYPSLTELTYVKGVTSAIQTQIGAKKTDSMTTARLLGRTTAGTGVIEEITVGSGLNLAAGVLNTTSGTNIVLNKTVTDVTVNATPETKVYSYTVPANTLAAGDILDLIARFRKTGTAGTMITRIRFGVNNSTADNIMATMTSAAATLTQNMERTWVIKDATHIEVYPPTSNVNTDIASSGTAITSVTVDLTVTNYIVITIQDASAVDTGIFSAFYVRKN